MIAPADYLDPTPAQLLTVDADSAIGDELLPWADPYIAQLFSQHEVELAAKGQRRHCLVRPRVVPVRRELTAVA